MVTVAQLMGQMEAFDNALQRADLRHCVVEHSNSGEKFRFDSRYRIDFFFDSIRQSDKFAACTLIFK